ncbi:segregation/condensation protein A [Candidatus Saganbacteria bacterium]|nr:segregation/condensation protein A [Candidatus Saganbacteria bacterium]
MTRDTVYKIESEVYTGPFDLLLKAIDDGEIEIFKISLAQITVAYFSYWQREAPALVLAADFLLMAAYLLEIKAKALLPARETLLEQEVAGVIEETLIDHIQEYQVYKEMARTLRQRKEIFEKVYGRHEGETQEKHFELVDVDLRDLVLAFKRVYDDAAKREAVVPIMAEEVTLEKRITEVKTLIAGRKDGVPFIDIFLRKTKLEIVVTFLAILELAKQSFLRIVQDRRFSAILIFERGMYDQQHGSSGESNNPTVGKPAVEPGAEQS